MAFMQPVIHKDKNYFVTYESNMDQGPEFLSESSCPRLPPGIYTRDELLSYRNQFGRDTTREMIEFFREKDIDDFEILYQYWGWMSAPGYMDRSDVFLGESYAEIADQLLEMFYDGDPEYLDDSQKEEIEWLQSLIDEEKEAVEEPAQ
jgi:hypothetical protein